jgi:hypothetical protein
MQIGKQEGQGEILEGQKRWERIQVEEEEEQEEPRMKEE